MVDRSIALPFTQMDQIIDQRVAADFSFSGEYRMTGVRQQLSSWSCAQGMHRFKCVARPSLWLASLNRHREPLKESALPALEPCDSYPNEWTEQDMTKCQIRNRLQAHRCVTVGRVAIIQGKLSFQVHGRNRNHDWGMGRNHTLYCDTESAFSTTSGSTHWLVLL